MIDRHLVNTCEIVTESFNEYGDREEQSSVEVSCWWRDITVQRQDANGEISDADAFVWFKGSESVTKGTVLRYEGALYQVERITVARRLGELTKQFLKTEVKIIQIS